MNCSRLYTLFDTDLGRLGILWSETGIAATYLPESSADVIRRRILARFPTAGEAAPPPSVRAAIQAIQELLRGEAKSLLDIKLDLDRLQAFHRDVYEIARRIPAGETTTYGEIAKVLGMPGAARAVGQALGRNPFPIIVPCHRVLAAGGKCGGFSGSGGIATKLRLLSIERPCGTSSLDLFGNEFAPPYETRSALLHLRTRDPMLARVIDTVGDFTLRLKPTPSTFHALAEAIIHQQLSTKAAATIFARICSLFPNPHHGLDAARVLRMPDEKLRMAGVSPQKILSLRDLAAHCTAGELPTLQALNEMADEAIMENLTRVRGIGRWTCEMLLIFRLGRPDVLPLDDLGLQNGFALACGKPTRPVRAELEKRAEKWRPYRSVASWYLWQLADRI